MLLLADMEESLYPPNNTGAAFWRQSAASLLTATSRLAWSPTWSSLLSNGTVNNRAVPPMNDTGIIYGTMTLPLVVLGEMTITLRPHVYR